MTIRIIVIFYAVAVHSHVTILDFINKIRFNTNTMVCEVASVKLTADNLKIDVCVSEF